MRTEKTNPAAAVTANGALGSYATSRLPCTTGNTARPRVNKASLTARLGGRIFVLTGRHAQTLDLLIRVGSRGFTSGEASSLGWARRTSAYVANLREMGFPILTTREAIGDASVGRYTLAGQVEVMGKDAKTE